MNCGYQPELNLKQTIKNRSILVFKMLKFLIKKVKLYPKNIQYLMLMKENDLIRSCVIVKILHNTRCFRIFYKGTKSMQIYNRLAVKRKKSKLCKQLKKC